MIFQHEQFCDENGRAIIRRTPIVSNETDWLATRKEGEAYKFPAVGPNTFHATGTLQIVNGPAMQFSFEIPAATLEEAFAGLEAAFEDSRQRAEAEFKEKMMAAQQQQAGQLVLPNGQQIPRTNRHPKSRFR